MRIMFALVAVTFAYVAFRSVDRLTVATAHSERWGAVDETLLELSDDIGGLAVETDVRSRRVSPLDVVDDTLVEKVDDAMALLRANLETDDPQGAARVDAQLTALRSASRDVVETSEATQVAQRASNDVQVERRLRELINAYMMFRLHLGRTESLSSELESAAFAQLTSQGRDQLRLAGFAAIPLTLLAAMSVVAGRQIRRREQRLLADLADQQRLSQAIVDCLPLEIAWKDVDHHIVGINRPLLDRLSAWDAPDPIGRTFDEVAPASGIETWKSVRAMERSAIDSGQPVVDEFTVDTGSGPRTLRFSSSPLVRDEVTVGAITFTEDVTEQRELELALATGGRLESIGQLAAGVAHEINTPISSSPTTPASSQTRSVTCSAWSTGSPTPTVRTGRTTSTASSRTATSSSSARRCPARSTSPKEASRGSPRSCGR